MGLTRYFTGKVVGHCNGGFNGLGSNEHHNCPPLVAPEQNTPGVQGPVCACTPTGVYFHQHISDLEAIVSDVGEVCSLDGYW